MSINCPKCKSSFINYQYGTYCPLCGVDISQYKKKKKKKKKREIIFKYSKYAIWFVITLKLLFFIAIHIVGIEPSSIIFWMTSGYAYILIYLSKPYLLLTCSFIITFIFIRFTKHILFKLLFLSLIILITYEIYDYFYPNRIYKIEYKQQ